MIEFVEGVLALDQLPLGHDDLLRVGRLIRQIHDASEDMDLPDTEGWNVLLPAENPDLMCTGPCPVEPDPGGAVGLHRLGCSWPKHAVGFGVRRAIFRRALCRPSRGRSCGETAGSG